MNSFGDICPVTRSAALVFESLDAFALNSASNHRTLPASFVSMVSWTVEVMLLRPDTSPFTLKPVI